MIENDPGNVLSAFEMLLEEVEAEIDFVNGIGARAFEGRDYERAREALDRVAQFSAFRDKVAAMLKDVDRQPLASDPSKPRWCNAAHCFPQTPHWLLKPQSS